MTTHFASGLTNVSGNSVFTALKQPFPNLYYNQNFDFFEYTSGQWTKTDTGTGTVANVSGAGGLVQLKNDAAGATDAIQVQWAGGAGASELTVFWDATKDLIMNARVKADNATNSAWLIGAATVDTTVVASLPTDGLYFYKASAATTLIASTRKAATSSSITLGATADDTYATMSLIYTATDATWRASLNGTVLGSITTTTNSPTNGLCVSLAIQNASAVAHLLTVDYLNFMVER